MLKIAAAEGAVVIAAAGAVEGKGGIANAVGLGEKGVGTKCTLGVDGTLLLACTCVGAVQKQRTAIGITDKGGQFRGDQITCTRKIFVVPIVGS